MGMIEEMFSEVDREARFKLGYFFPGKTRMASFWVKLSIYSGTSI